MRKKGLSILIITIMMFLFMPNVYAANATISAKAGKTSIAVGEKVNVTVTVSSSSALGSWQYTLNYDKSIFTAVSTTPLGNVDQAYNGNTKNKSYTYTFKANKAGTGTFSLVNCFAADWDTDSFMQVSTKSTSVTVKTKEQIQASYSKNNYLKSLSVEGATLDPVFDKEKLEYSITLQPGTDKIVVSATKEDNTASIVGTGTKEVSEGANKIEISVTAQNGNVRKYIINATVTELKPIAVVVNDQPFTVVRSKESLTMPKTFTETTVTIEGEEIPAFTSEITNFTLIGLKDSEGNVELYIYDVNKDSYELYEELNFNGIVFNVLPTNNIPFGYTKSSIIINDIKVDCFKYNDQSDFVIIYGMDIESGNKGFYVYDKADNTLQRYNDSIISELNQKLDNYFYICVIFGGGALVSTLLLIVVASKKTKKIQRALEATAKVPLEEIEKKNDKKETR